MDTHEESLTRLLLMGKSSVTVRELSRFEIREETVPDGARRAIIDLPAGRIRVTVARRLMKPGDEVQIRTANAIAAVRGTDGIFEVTTLADGTPRTVVTGVSGEFEVTLPSTRPFAAMARGVSDVGPGLLLASSHVPGTLKVLPGVQVQVDGVAGLARVLLRTLSAQDVEFLSSQYLVPISARRSRPVVPREDEEVARARTQATRGGLLPANVLLGEIAAGIGGLDPRPTVTRRVMDTPVLPTGSGDKVRPSRGPTILPVPAPVQ